MTDTGFINYIMIGLTDIIMVVLAGYGMYAITRDAYYFFKRGKVLQR